MNDSTTMRLCFAPKDHNRGYNDDAFLTLAFQQGKVLTIEDFAYEWQNKGGEQFLNYELRLIPIEKTCWEFCHHCDNEVELETKWEVQTCPVCGCAIAPCNLCFPYDSDCNKCPLDKECRKRNKAEFTFERFKNKLSLQLKRAHDELENDDNLVDIRAYRYPYDPKNDIAIFCAYPPKFEEIWNFVKDAEEWSVELYENLANGAEFMDRAVTSDEDWK